MSSTESPLSRKNSATAIAVRGARRRIIGTFVARLRRRRPQAREPPSASSRNSRTSRPRSPTRAMTTASKSREPASMARRVDLPTPGAGENADALPGANRREEIDDADAGAQGSRDPRAAHGGRRRGVDLDGRLALCSGPAPSIGTPRALMTRPFQLGCGARRKGPSRVTCAPRHVSVFDSNALMLAPCASMRTTSARCLEAPSPKLTQSPSFRNGDSPATRACEGETSAITPLILTSGSVAASATPRSSRASASSSARARLTRRCPGS